jgi:hypothetical protein
MAGVIENFVVLKPGIPVTLHFSDHRVVSRQITDPVRLVAATRETLLFYVDEVGGTKVDKVYSILSQKHAAEFAGYLPGKKYVGYRFTVIKDAPGFVPPRIVKVEPL